LRTARGARRALKGSDDLPGRIARLAAAIDDLPEERRAAGLDLLAALETLVRGGRSGG